MSTDELLQALESKTGEDFLLDLQVRAWSPPLRGLLDRLFEQPSALRVTLLVIVFDTLANMEGVEDILDNDTGLIEHQLDETIAAMQEIGALSTARTLANLRAIMGRHGVDLTDREGLAKYYRDHSEDEGNRLRQEIRAEAGNFTYAHDAPYEGEDVLGCLLAQSGRSVASDPVVQGNRSG